MPELSVIMPVYNAGKILRYSIKSILEQTYQNFELILVNDGSQDDSGKICEEFAKKDSRIRVIHKENGGAGSARNVGIEVARGEYVAFPDADDFCKPDMYLILLNQAKNTQADLTLCALEEILVDRDFNYTLKSRQTLFDRYVTTTPEVRKLWFELRTMNIGLLNSPCNKIYKTAIIRDNGIKFPKLKRAQDAVFNLYYYNLISSVCVVDQSLYQYNVNDVERTGRKFPKDVHECFLEYNRVMEKIISGWGMYGGAYKALCDNNLLGNIDNCICLCENPVWGLSRKQKVAYLSAMIDDEYLQYRIQTYSGNVTEIEDIIAPIVENDPKWILKVLRKRKVLDKLRKSIVGSCWRIIKGVWGN